ncbi:MAG TPA: FtsX-like permease family protein [Candidatus Kryptonia bacterium]
MLKSYFKFAFRNLWRNKAYSFINIFGLSVGLASCFIILLYSVHELSYDRYNEKLDRINLLTMNFTFKSQGWTQPLVPFPTGPTLKTEYPEVKEFARCGFSSCTIKCGGRIFDFVPCASADSGIFKILTLPVVSGNLEKAFAERNYAVISPEMAKRMFGNGEAVGQVINVKWYGQEYYLTVAAVMANIPSTSTFQADCILPIFLAERSIQKGYASNPDILNAWMPGVINTYLLLSNKNLADQFNKKLVTFSREHSTIPSWPLVLHLVPLKELYFRPETIVNTYLIPKGNIADVEIYSTVALLILLIACLNFVTLSSARTSIRTKEVGMRKVVGASRLDIAKQIMVESMLVSILSLPIALVLVEFFMPSLTTLLGKRLPTDYNRSIDSIILYVGITLAAGVLSGSYLSSHLSSFHPAEILRNKFNMGHDRITLCRILIGVQMVIFIGLLLTSITIYRQMRYLHTKDMGFEAENLVVFSNWKTSFVDADNGTRFQTLLSDLETFPNVLSVAAGTWIPPTPGAAGDVTSQAPNLTNPQMLVLFTEDWVSHDYFEALRMKMIYGKTFGQVPPEEAKDAVIMNQEAIEEFGITDPSVQLFEGHRIIGVVKDFNFLSLHQKIGPAVFYGDQTRGQNNIVVRLKSSKDAPKTIPAIERQIEEFDGGKEAHYQFFDDRVSAMYGSDYKFADMIAYFTVLAISIACLGLFGMSLFVIQRRVKEVGVRKVLGASVTSILLSSAKEFVMVLLVSAIISLPISTYFINSWLRDYAYHINVDIISVLVTFLVGLLIVFLTISYQGFKAATANPVESLRYE